MRPDIAATRDENWPTLNLETEVGGTGGDKTSHHWTSMHVIEFVFRTQNRMMHVELLLQKAHLCSQGY